MLPILQEEGDLVTRPIQHDDVQCIIAHITVRAEMFSE